MLSCAVSKVHWKTPGVDGVQNVLYKCFPFVYSKLAEFYSQILSDTCLMSEMFTKGVIYMIPKTVSVLDYSLK